MNATNLHCGVIPKKCITLRGMDDVAEQRQLSSATVTNSCKQVARASSKCEIRHTITRMSKQIIIVIPVLMLQDILPR